MSANLLMEGYNPTTDNIDLEAEFSGGEDPESNTQKYGEKENRRWRKLHLSRAKLSGVTQMATLLAGFSVVAIVDLDIKDDSNPVLLAIFALTSALLVGTTMISLMIATCILPHVEAIAGQGERCEAHESPDQEMENYINISWLLANTVSILLFAVDVVLLSWLKFDNNSPAAICTTIVIVPVLFIILIFGLLFYKKLITHQSQMVEQKFKKLDSLQMSLEHSTRSQRTVHVV